MSKFFWENKYEPIDNKLFTQLAIASQSNGNKCSEKLANVFFVLITKLLNQEEFVSITNDWKAEIANDCLFHLCNVLKQFDFEKSGAFQYFYTCGINRMRRCFKKLKNDFAFHESLKIKDINELEFLSAKKKLLKNDEIKEDVARHIKSIKGAENLNASISKSVGLAIRNTIKCIDSRCTELLLEKARKVNNG